MKVKPANMLKQDFASLKQNIYQLFSNKATVIFLSLTLPLFFAFYISAADAQSSMSNNSYKILWPNLNSFSGKSTDSNVNLDITGGQVAISIYSGSNYSAVVGFPYIPSTTSTSTSILFTFSISSVFIDFGPITPGAPLTRTSTLTISNGASNGYNVHTYENHPLRALSTGINIPDTTCDSGTCNESTAAEWINLTTYGFGYRCDNISGSDCSTDFANPSYYKHFASSETGETMQPVMTGGNIGSDISSQITYKINISAAQEAGIYQNSITYIAIPSI